MLKTDLALYDNSWYKPGNVARRACWYFTNAIFFKSSLFPFSWFKVFLLKLFGTKAGKNIRIKPGVNIKYPWFLTLGSNVWIGEKVWIDNLGKIKIGNNVCLSQGCILLSGNHDFTRRAFDLVIKDITIENGVWIGAKAIVCGGIVCKEHAVLTAGSVAGKDLDAFAIYQGNPAIKIKERIIV
jgi:putative colanic acid biosynthesis acetyltransferase WcaF